MSSLEKKAEELTHTNLQLQVNPLSLRTLSLTHPITSEDNQHSSPFTSLQFHNHAPKRPNKFFFLTVFDQVKGHPLCCYTVVFQLQYF